MTGYFASKGAGETVVVAAAVVVVAATVVVVEGAAIVVSAVPEEQLATNITAAINSTVTHLMSSPLVVPTLLSVSGDDLARAATPSRGPLFVSRGSGSRI
jgi:hypothetical protein